MAEETMAAMMQAITEQMMRDANVQAYEAAITDAHIFGAGWLMVDQAGKIRYVKPGDLRGWVEQTKDAY